MGWADLTIRELSVAANIPERTIARWMSGATTPPPDAIDRIADATGMPANLVAGNLA